MAKIALDLTQFKSAGVYTVEIDNTERVIVNAQALRLVPGFSMQGPYNTPVFIRSNRDLEKFFGPLDTKLERKGSFFHRSIQTCLLSSPVIAINLLRPDETRENGDKIEFVGLGLNVDDVDASLAAGVYPSDFYVNFFNRDRFWTPDPEYLQTSVINKYDASGAYDSPLLQFVNTSPKNYSVIVRKAPSTLRQYNVFAIDWFGSQANIPYEWIRPYDYIKDYFIQVVVVEGDWTDYGRLSTDPYYSNFFNADGLIPRKLNNFINASNVNLIGSWTGCIIPDFYDKTGANQYIEEIINANVALTGFVININQQAFDQIVRVGNAWQIGETGEAAPYEIDLVGHNLITDSDGIQSRFLSYDISVLDTTIHNTITVGAVDGTGRNFIITDASDAALVTVGTLIQKTDEPGVIPGVTYVTEKLWNSASEGYVITTAEHVTAGNVVIQKPIDDPTITTHYKFIKLNGFNILNKHLPGFNTSGAASVEAGVEKIYSMLEDPGIHRGLVNTDMIFYRYIVDTMAYGLEHQLGGKKYLSRLAKARGKCTALLNAPAMAHFASSTDPYFSDRFDPEVDPKPALNVDWIAEGGNPDMQRSFRFTLPDEENGSKYCGVFGPYLKYNDGGKVSMVPPAADVANAYVKKFLGGNPYAAVANRNGIISNPNVIGVEYMIDKKDRDSLEPFGYNSIIEKATTGQIMIYANSTAYQTIKSDFNNLHVRELLNTIEIQIEDVIGQYIFDFNNAVTRLNIVNSITPILETIKDAGALIKYEVVMDETNNPKELIAEGFGIIDINVWVTDVLKKIVNRITLNKDYGISSGGFVF
jgi:hypothetical protein